MRFEYDAGEDLSESRRPVGDVKVACRLNALTGGGQFGLTWRFGEARLETAIDEAGRVELAAWSKSPDGAPDHSDGSGRLARSPGEPSRLEFLVRDGWACLVEDGREVASLSFAAQSIEDAQAAPQATESPRVALFARKCAVQLDELRLFRDVYYLSPEELSAESGFAWGMAPQPCSLADDEYYFLGDNSPNSKDSRFFGGVREDALQGVTKWLFWPPRRWRSL
jgi:hypothetical protein